MRRDAGVGHVRERELVRPLTQQRRRQAEAHPVGLLARKLRLAHQRAVDGHAHVVVDRLAGLGRPLQEDVELGRSGSAAGSRDTREREGLHPRRPRGERLPQPQVRRLEQPRLVEPVRLEGARDGRRRGDRVRARRRGLKRHRDAARATDELEGHLGREVGRGRGPLGVEVEPAAGAEGVGRGLEVEAHRLALPLETQLRRREAPRASRKDLLEAHGMQSHARAVEPGQDLARDGLAGSRRAAAGSPARSHPPRAP